MIAKLNAHMKDPTFRRREKVETKLDTKIKLLSSIQLDMLHHNGYI